MADARQNFLDSLNNLIGSGGNGGNPLGSQPLSFHTFQTPDVYSPSQSVQNIADQASNPSPAPSSSGSSGGSFMSDLGQGLLGFGKSAWDGITTALDYGLAKPVQTALLYPFNAITALRDVGTGKASNWLNDFQNMTGTDVQNLWSQKNSPVAQQAIDRWAGGDPNNPLSVGHWVDPAAQLLSGGAEAKMLGEAGRLLGEGVGRIPGISNWADSAAAKAAGKAFTPAAADAGAVDSVTVNPGDLQARPSGSGAIPQPSGQWPVPTQDFNFSGAGTATAPEAASAFDPMAAASDMRSPNLPQLQPTSPGQFTFNPDVLPPNRITGNVPPVRNIVDGEFRPVDGGLPTQPSPMPLQPTGLQPYTFNPEVLGGTNLPGRTAPIRNIVDGELAQAPSGMPPPTSPTSIGGKASPEVEQLMQRLAGKEPEAGPLAQTTPEAEVVNPGSSNRIRTQPPMNTQEASYNPISPKDEYVNQVLQSMSPGEKLSSAINGEFIQPFKDRVSQAMFKLGIGSGINRLSDTVRNTILNNRGKLDTMDQAVNDNMVNLAKEAKAGGLSRNDLELARNQYETGGIDSITNTAAKGIFQKLADATKNGVEGADVGLAHETTAGINPDSLINNYIHLSTERPTMFDFIKGKFKQDQGINPVTRGYANERYFKTAQTARDAGYDVRDSISSTADRLKESNKDLRNVELHNELANMADKTPEISDVIKPGMERFQSGYANSALNGKYVSPELNKYLKGLERQPLSQKDTFLGAAARTLDRATSLYRNLDMYNPLVHSHNIIGNALMSFGLHPQNYADAEIAMGNSKLGKALGGTSNYQMDQSLKEAQRTGALGAQHKDVFSQIKNTLDPSLLGNVKAGMNNFQDAALWNRERAVRLGVFHQARQEALARGLTAEDASNVARDVTNKHMIDYTNNNLSPVEQELWSRLDPFYRWHKGNYPLQFQNLANPKFGVKVNVARDAANNINQAVSGHSQAQNSGGPNIQNNNIQGPNGTSYDPYLPYEEINKVLNSRAGEFAWNRLNPVLKEAVQQIANKKYAPLQSMQPDGHDYRAATPLTNPANNLMEDLQQRLSHAAGSLAPQMLQNIFSFANYDPEGYKVNPLVRAGLGATGGFVNPNLQSPQSDNMQAKAELNYMQKALRQKLRGN